MPNRSDAGAPSPGARIAEPTTEVDSAILDLMDPSAPATIRIRFNLWYTGTLSGGLGIGLMADVFATLESGTALEWFDLLRIAAWLLGIALPATGVMNYMRVSTDAVVHFRDWVGRRVTAPLRPGDPLVVTDEDAFIWRLEGHYEQLDVQPHWAGRREWNRLRAWAAQHWTQPVDPRPRVPDPR